MSQTVHTPEAWNNLLSISEEMKNRVETFNKKASEQKSAVDSAIKDTVSELIKYACIDEIQAEQTANILSDHATAIGFIRKLASRQSETPLGSPTPAGTTNPVKRANHLSNHTGDPLQSEASINLLAQSRNWRA